MPGTFSISQARSALSAVFSRAVHEHRPVAIARGLRERGFLLGESELERLLEPYEFHPEVVFEKCAVSFWLPELALYGRGSSYDEAREDLIEEIRAYVEEYLENAPVYLRAPNRAEHFPHVMKAFVADADGRLLEVVFAPPAAEAEAPLAATDVR